MVRVHRAPLGPFVDKGIGLAPRARKVTWSPMWGELPTAGSGCGVNGNSRAAEARDGGSNPPVRPRRWQPGYQPRSGCRSMPVSRRPYTGRSSHVTVGGWRGAQEIRGCKRGAHLERRRVHARRAPALTVEGFDSPPLHVALARLFGYSDRTTGTKRRPSLPEANCEVPHANTS